MPQGKQAPTGHGSLSSPPPLSRKHIESQNAYSFWLTYSNTKSQDSVSKGQYDNIWLVNYFVSA